jgi:signal transduction histidine kinase
LLLTRRRYWWIILATSLPAHIAAEFESGVPVAMVLSWFLSNSVQALLGAILIHHFLGDEVKLDRTRHLTIFLVFGAFLAPFLSSFLDASLVKLNGWGVDSYSELWQVRFLSNVLATLTLVPFILEWAQSDLAALKQIPTDRFAEALLLVAALFGVGYVVFNGQQRSFINTPSSLYWPLPFLVWATARFGLRGVSTVLILVTFLVIIGATRGGGPFITRSSAENALAIQLFLIVVIVPLLVLAAIIKERRLSEEALTDINARNQAILRALPDMMFLQDRSGVYLDYYARDPKMLLVPPESFLGRNLREFLPPALATQIAGIIDSLEENAAPQVIEYSLQIENQERHFEARLVNAGANVLSIVRDITDAKRAAEAIKRSEQRLSQSTKVIRSLAGKLITAQESERRRISILLHDDVGQNVAVLALTINGLKRRLPEDPHLILAELDKVYGQLDSLASQIRELSHQLHPAALEHLGLVKALRTHVDELSNEEQLAVRFSADVRTDPVPPEIAVCIYRVALEALRNVSVHSGASSADVTLREVDHALVLEVADSGKGFDVEKLRHGTGLGLASSEERVKLLHGSLEILSVANYGTRLTARVPLKNSR